MTARFAALGILVALAGCGTYSPPGTAEFKAGYFNGCMHGYALDAPHVEERDDQRYAGSEDYRVGWNQGHGECADDALSGVIAESWHP